MESSIQTPEICVVLLSFALIVLFGNAEYQKRVRAKQLRQQDQFWRDLERRRK